MKYVIVLTTTSSEEEARNIAKALIERRLAACVSIVKNVESIYVWRGKVESAHEFLLIVKTREDLAQRVIESIKELHSYEVPEALVVPVERGLETYLRWIDSVVEGRE